MVFAVSAVSVAVWASLLTQNTRAFTPHYLAYQGDASKIFVLSETSSWATANQSYLDSEGQMIPQGSQLFVVSVTLRNDYSSENPAPAAGESQAAPIEGTAYIYLNTILYNKDGIVDAVNVSPSDFTVPPAYTGVVLASGQTNSVNIYLATNKTDVSSFLVSLNFVGDSIPT